MIGHLNRFIHRGGKYIFAILLVVLIPSFVVLLSTGTPTIGSRLHEKAGEIFDKKVTNAQVLQAHKFVQYRRDLFRLKQGKNTGKLAFQRLVMARAARRMGLQIDDSKLRETVRDYPLFKTDGKFDQQKLELHFKLIRQQYRMDDLDFDRFIRSELEMDLMKRVMQSSARVSDLEVTPEFNKLYQPYDIRVVSFDSTNLIHEVEISEEELKIYYDDNSLEFRTAEQRSFTYVVFKYDEFKEELAAKVTDEQLLPYYESNKQQYIDTENDTTNSFAEARAELLEDYLEPQLQKAATRRATDFQIEINDTSDTSENAFEDLAKKENLDLHTTELVTSETAGGIFKDEPILLQSGFYLSLEQPYSRPITLENQVAILKLENIKAGEVPELKTIRDEVLEKQKLAKAQELVMDKAQKFLDHINKNPDSDDLIGGTSIKHEGISLTDRNLDIPNSFLIQTMITTIDVGEWSRPLPSKEGAMVISLLARHDPSEETIEKEYENFKNIYRQRKGQTILNAWINDIVKEANIKINQ